MSHSQPQWIITTDDGTELLLSFWDGLDGDPECAPRVDHTRWGAPLEVRRLDAYTPPARRNVPLADVKRAIKP